MLNGVWTDLFAASKCRRLVKRGTAQWKHNSSRDSWADDASMTPPPARLQVSQALVFSATLVLDQPIAHRVW